MKCSTQRLAQIDMGRGESPPSRRRYRTMSMSRSPDRRRRSRSPVRRRSPEYQRRDASPIARRRSRSPDHRRRSPDYRPIERRSGGIVHGCMVAWLKAWSIPHVAILVCREERLPPPPPRPPMPSSSSYGIQPAHYGGGYGGGGRSGGFDHDDPGPMSSDFPEYRRLKRIKLMEEGGWSLWRNTPSPPPGTRIRCDLNSTLDPLSHTP